MHGAARAQAGGVDPRLEFKIHFLMWVTYAASNRNRVFRTSLSLKDLRENQKRSAITQKLGKQRRASYNQGPQS